MDLRRGERGVAPRRASRRRGARRREHRSRRSRPPPRTASTPSSSTCSARPDGALVLAHGPELPPGAPALDDALALAARLGLAVQLDVKARRRRAGRRRRPPPARPARAVLRQLVLAADPRGLRGGRAGAAAVVHVSRGPPRRLRAAGCCGRPSRPALAVLRALLPRRLPGWLRGRRRARGDAQLDGRRRPAAVAACHAAGAAVFVWTVNDARSHAPWSKWGPTVSSATIRGSSRSSW